MEVNQICVVYRKEEVNVLNSVSCRKSKSNLWNVSGGYKDYNIA